MPLYAAPCRCSQWAQCKYALFLALASFFEPEGRGFESLPACHSNSAIECLKSPALNCAAVGSHSELCSRANPSRRAISNSAIECLKSPALNCAAVGST